MSYATIAQDRSESNIATRLRALHRWSGDKSIALTLLGSFAGSAAVFAATRAPGVFSAAEPVWVVAGLGLLVAAFRNWKLGISVLLVVVILEGAIRKWFMPSATELVYFYKDVLMVATLAGYFRTGRKTPLVIKQRLRMLLIVMGVFLLYTVVSVGLALDIHPLIGLLGLKAYCLYIPLAFLAPRAFPDKERLINFLKWYSLIVLPVAVIGVMQFMDSDRGSQLNRYAVGEQMPGRAPDIAVFSTSGGNYFVRITSTFSYVTGLSVYLPIMFALLLAMTSLYSKRALPRWSKILYYSALGATVVTCFMTGSRGSVVSMVVIALIFYVFTSGRRAIRRVQQIAVTGVILYVAFTAVFPQAYDAFYNRAFGGEERVSEGWSRITDVLTPPTNEASYAGMFGYGIGLTQNAVPALMRRLGIAEQDNPIPIGFEGEPGRVTLELGVVGFLLYTLLRLIVLITICRIAFAIRDYESKVLAFAAAAALVVPLVAGGSITTHTLNVYQWFLVGVVFALYNAERIQLRMQKNIANQNLECRTSNRVPTPVIDLQPVIPDPK